MKIVVIGAAGRTGRLVVEQALARGHQVIAYVRDSHGIAAKPGLQIIVHPLRDVPALTAALRGADGVLVCLGTYKKKPIDLMQQSLPPIIDAMKQAQVARMVLLSAYGVGDSARSSGFIARLIYKSMVRSVFQDKERSEKQLQHSGLKWTSVYPVGLTDQPAAHAIEVRPMNQVSKVAGLPRISRADVARVMLDATTDAGTIGQRLLVTSKGSVR